MSRSSNFSQKRGVEKSCSTLSSATEPEHGSARHEAFEPTQRSGAMSTVMRQDPWGVMPRLQEEINRLFGNTRETDSSSATANWVPPVDIHEYADRFELYVDLPGIDAANVELTLDGGVLTLSGDRREQVMTKNG